MKQVIRFLYDILMRIEYFFKKKKYKQITILSTEKTIDEIKNNNLSVCRFGDGELKLALGIKSISFQKNDEEMKNRLIEVLTSNKNNIMVCLPRVWNHMNENNYFSTRYWRLFLHRYFYSISKYLSNNKVYGNASFTRPYMPLKNKKNSGLYFKKIKEIWDKKDITIIEGKNTRLGVGNNLFDNANSIERILCPATNAFDCYDRILNEAKTIDSNRLILIALGPTATILAYDLADFNHQSIDIGHIDLEYEWFLRGAKKRQNIEGKAVNEVSSKNENVEEIYDENYENSIIKIIE